MIKKLSDKDLDKIADRFSKLFIKMVTENSKEKFLNELKLRARMSEKDMHYFNLEDETMFDFIYEQHTSWGTVKAFLKEK